MIGCSHNSRTSPLRSVPQLKDVLHKGYLLRMEMIHFIRNLHNFMMFEVMECAWTDLASNIERASTLDELVSAHQQYLTEIVNKALMVEDAPVARARAGHQRTESKAQAVAQAEAAIAARGRPAVSCLFDIFNVMLRFTSVQVGGLEVNLSRSKLCNSKRFSTT